MAVNEKRLRITEFDFNDVKDNLKTLLQSKCSNCNTFFKFNFKFCPKCGTGVVPFQTSSCFACNTTLIQNSKFCSKCGMPVKGKVM